MSSGFIRSYSMDVGVIAIASGEIRMLRLPDVWVRSPLPEQADAALDELFADGLQVGAGTPHQSSEPVVPATSSGGQPVTCGSCIAFALSPWCRQSSVIVHNCSQEELLCTRCWASPAGPVNVRDQTDTSRQRAFATVSSLVQGEMAALTATSWLARMRALECPGRPRPCRIGRTIVQPRAAHQDVNNWVAELACVDRGISVCEDSTLVKTAVRTPAIGEDRITVI